MLSVRRAAAEPELINERSQAGSGSPHRGFDVLYEELHFLASTYLRRERRDHTLQPTALVSEAYLRLANTKELGALPRPEFLSLAAVVMRHVLVDYARQRNTAKRGGDRRPLSINTRHDIAKSRGAPVDVLAIDEALSRLEGLHPRQARLAQFRLFAGLTIEEAAPLLGIATSTASKDWEMARAWLARELFR